MLTIFFMFGVVTAMFELYLVWKIKFLYKFITTSQYGEVLGIFFSIALSLLISALFGAAGVIVMAGAVISTIITAITYRLKIIPTVLNFIQATHDAIVGFFDGVRTFIRNVKRIYFTLRHPIHHVKGRNPYVLHAA